MRTNDFAMMDVYTNATTSRFSMPKAKSKNCTIIIIGHMDDSGPALHCGNSIDLQLRRDRELRTFPPCSKNKNMTHLESLWIFLRAKLAIPKLFLQSAW